MNASKCWFWISADGKWSTRSEIKERMDRFTKLATHGTIKEVVTWRKQWNNGKVTDYIAAQFQCADSSVFENACKLARENGLCFERDDPRKKYF